MWLVSWTGQAGGRPMYRTLALVVVLTICGCASREQIEARQAAARAAIDAQDDAKCRSFGATPGSQAYFQCRMTLDQTRTQITAAQDAQIQENSMRMMEIGASMIR